MRFGRKRNNRRYEEKSRRTGQSRPKLALVGAIVLTIGILLVMYGTNIRNLDIMMGGGFVVMVSVILLLLSLSKRNQIRFAKGMKATSDAFKEPCHCCKCTNCGRNHNHWTHD